jgi:hypothetical protein
LSALALGVNLAALRGVCRIRHEKGRAAMTYGQLLAHFFHDGKVEGALVAIVLDFVFGVLAALKLGTFRLSYVGDFLRNDVLFKLVPYFVLYSGSLLAGHQRIVISGLDMGTAAGAVYVAIMAAWVGSILGSLRQLGFSIPGVPAPSPAPSVPAKTRVAELLTGPENPPPPQQPVPAVQPTTVQPGQAGG